MQTSAASSRRNEPTRLKGSNQKGKWTGYGSLTWPYVNVAPPAYGMDLRVIHCNKAERGKPVYLLRQKTEQAKPQGTLLKEGGRVTS